MNVNERAVLRQFGEERVQGCRGGVVPKSLHGSPDLREVFEDIRLTKADGPYARTGENGIDRADRGENDRLVSASFETERTVESHLGLRARDMGVIERDDDRHSRFRLRHRCHPYRSGSCRGAHLSVIETPRAHFRRSLADKGTNCKSPARGLTGLAGVHVFLTGVTAYTETGARTNRSFGVP